MKLIFNPFSPYARKVRVAALELGLADRLDPVIVSTTPLVPDVALAAANPLAKLPVLILDDGSSLYDSRVIVDYLDSFAAPDTRLIPAEGPARWAALRWQAIGDGIADAALSVRYEATLRPEPLRYTAWADAQWGKVEAALDALDSEADALAERFTIGAAAIGSALFYLDARFPDASWRPARPALAAVAAAWAGRGSFIETAPR